MYKRTVKFIDDNGKKFIIETEIKDGRFSMSGESGQCQDQIKPRTDAQQKLVDIWNKWHLNDMKAGTPEQEAYLESEDFQQLKKEFEANTDNIKALKKLEGIKSYYDFQCFSLKQAGLNPVKYKGKVFHYGNAWLKRELPESFHETIDELFDAIVEEEQARRGESLSDMDDDDLLELIKENHDQGNERDNELFAALVRMFDLTENDFDDIQIDNNRVTVQGTDYLAGTDEEMDVEWDDDLQNYLDEIVLDEIKDETLKKYFDEDAWKSDAKHDGRAHSLNRYDGGEESCTINGTEYYAYRQ